MGLDKDDIMALIAILQKGLTDDDNTTEQDDNSVVTPPKSVTKQSPKKKSQKKNLFDSMSESRMHKEDVEIDRKLSKFPPTQRSRNYKPVKVRCRVCGKEETTNPVLVEANDRYKCNKCSSSPG